MQDLRYPIGKVPEQPFAHAPINDASAKAAAILDIQYLAQSLENAIQNLDEAQLNTPYRPDGWTVKKVVHHVADSHMNAFIRFKLGLTEDHPTIKPYEEADWANLADTAQVPVNVSLTLLHALHQRWTVLLNNIQDEQWSRTVFHPESKKDISLWQLLGTYQWHGKHHVAHITTLRDRMGW
jgi:hypothetical protein